MLPYIDACKRSGWGIFVLNPNQNKDPESNLEIAQSNTPDLHIWNIWKNYIVPSQFEDVYIVAQGAAGDSLNTI